MQEGHRSGTDGGLERSGVYSLTTTHHTHFMLIPSARLLITSMAPSTNAGSDHLRHQPRDQTNEPHLTLPPADTRVSAHTALTPFRVNGLLAVYII